MSERRQESDGKLYFTFNQGAEYSYTPAYCAPFTHKITACEWDDQTETEYYRIESAGKELPTRFSVKELKFLLSRLEHTQTAAGEPVELPLLLEEVQAFYGAKRAQLKKANIKENEKLKGTAYNANLQAIKGISDNLRFFNANGDQERAAELRKKLNELETANLKIVTEKKVDVRVLHKVPDCSKCADTGVLDGKICACALAQAKKIKAYNAELRLIRH